MKRKLELGIPVVVENSKLTKLINDSRTAFDLSRLTTAISKVVFTSRKMFAFMENNLNEIQAQRLGEQFDVEEIIESGVNVNLLEQMIMTDKYTPENLFAALNLTTASVSEVNVVINKIQTQQTQTQEENLSAMTAFTKSLTKRILAQLVLNNHQKSSGLLNPACELLLANLIAEQLTLKQKLSLRDFQNFSETANSSSISLTAQQIQQIQNFLGSSITLQEIRQIQTFLQTSNITSITPQQFQTFLENPNASSITPQQFQQLQQFQQFQTLLRNHINQTLNATSSQTTQTQITQILPQLLQDLNSPNSPTINLLIEALQFPVSPQDPQLRLIIIAQLIQTIAIYSDSRAQSPTQTPLPLNLDPYAKILSAA
jgi:hypothetical protein